MTSHASPSPEASREERAGLLQLRNGLLALHKVLLDWERIRYERTNGRITDNMKLLHLTINDPAFGWLRELSALIVQIDERMEDKKTPLSSADVKSNRSEIRELLSPSQTGRDFQRNYYWALQETPDIVVAHGEILKLLSSRGVR